MPESARIQESLKSREPTLGGSLFKKMRDQSLLRAIDKGQPVRRSRSFPTCYIADFQSADRPNLRVRKMVRTACRLEALRYSRLETCATTFVHGPA